jgi:hypothetical protein
MSDQYSEVGVWGNNPTTASADSRRLDWLGKQLVTVTGKAVSVYFEHDPKGPLSLRQAIDAASRVAPLPSTVPSETPK